MMKRIGAAALLTAVLAAPPAQAKENHYIGEVFAVPMRWCPEGALPTNGQVLPIAEYRALESVIGRVYGGDGKKTFALPNIDNPDFAGPKRAVTWCIDVNGEYPVKPEHGQ
jgi:microcystin-dependent protein